MIQLQEYVLYRAGGYSVHLLVNQMVRENGDIWNYGIKNRTNDVTEAVFPTLVQARMAADNLDRITKEIEGNGKPNLLTFPGGGVPN